MSKYSRSWFLYAGKAPETLGIPVFSVGGWYEIKSTAMEVDGGDEVGFTVETAGGGP